MKKSDKSIDAIRKRLKGLIGNKHYNQIALESGIPVGTIKSLFYARVKTTTIHTIALLCEYWEMTLFDFFNDDAFKTRFLDELE